MTFWNVGYLPGPKKNTDVDVIESGLDINGCPGQPILGEGK